MNEKQLQEIEARRERLVPDETWISEDYYLYAKRGGRKDLIVSGNSDDDICDFNIDKYDIEFIAHAHQDIPYLLAEVRRLRAVVEKYANRENWVRSVNTNGVFMDLWLYDEHGYTIAEECLREDGE